MNSAVNPSVPYEQHILVVRKCREYQETLKRVNNLASAMYEASRIREEKNEELEEILALLEGRAK